MSLIKTTEDLYREIAAYRPACEQEEYDRKQMLAFLREGVSPLERANVTAHFTASAWIVTHDRTQCLMVYHKIYDSWAWTGGHADGEADLRGVAEREAKEETGLSSFLVHDDILSLEILTVDGHEKRGKYVSSHLHYNVTYLLEADPEAPLRVCPDENTGVRWFSQNEVLSAVTEPWMAKRIYHKLIERSKIY